MSGYPSESRSINFVEQNFHPFNVKKSLNNLQKLLNVRSSDIISKGSNVG